MNGKWKESWCSSKKKYMYQRIRSWDYPVASWYISNKI